MLKKTKNLIYYEGVGRRREAVARVRLYLTGKEKIALIFGNKIKQGDIIVNKEPIDKVFPKISDKTKYLKPLKITDNENRFSISAIIRGGGKIGQLEAFILGLSRAIEKSDKEVCRPILKKEGLLKRDPRIRERRKVGTGGKARRAKQSPKR